jgi:hypothetical protein
MANRDYKACRRSKRSCWDYEEWRLAGERAESGIARLLKSVAAHTALPKPKLTLPIQGPPHRTEWRTGRP